MISSFLFQYSQRCRAVLIFSLLSFFIYFLAVPQFWARLPAYVSASPLRFGGASAWGTSGGSARGAATFRTLPVVNFSLGDFRIPSGGPRTYMRAISPLSHAALMALPSSFSLNKRSDARFGITAIISFYRRSWTMSVMVLRLLKSTVPPAEIWLVAFASEIEADLVAARESLRDNADIIAALAALGAAAPPIKFLRGDIHLSYFGRFQVALTARTPYTVIFDDDTIPGVRVLETAVHMAHTALGANSILSARGHDVQCPMMSEGMSSRSPVVVEEDTVGGFWFAPTELFRLLFRDRLISLVTSEDAQICAAARKYTGKSCLVVPMDPSDATTTTQDKEFDARASKGDTTMSTNMMPERTRVTREIFRRGSPIRARRDLRHPQAILVLVDDCESAPVLAAVVASVRRRTGISDDGPWFAAGTGACPDDRMVAAFPPGFAEHSWPTLDCSAGPCEYGKKTYGFFDLALGTNFPAANRPVDITVDSALTSHGLLELLQPRVVVIARSSSLALLGVALSARFLNIPFIAVGSGGASDDTRILAAFSISDSVVNVEAATDHILAIVSSTAAPEVPE